MVEAGQPGDEQYLSAVDLQVQFLHLEAADLQFVDHLEMSVEDPVSESQEEAHTVQTAGTAAEVAGKPMNLGRTRIGREEAHRVRSQGEPVVVPTADEHMDQEGEESVLEEVHEMVERRTDWVSVAAGVCLEVETSFFQVEALLLRENRVCLEADTFHPLEGAVAHPFVVPEAEEEQVVPARSQDVEEGENLSVPG